MFSQDATSPDAVPLPLADLERALLPFGESRMLPPAAYTSDEVFAWEQRSFFGSWQCVGRSTDVPETGSQTAVQVGATTALLVRGENGSLRAFANVCRHRGHEILGCGASTTKRAIVCPYHAWAYRLDGELFGAPGYRELPDFRPEEFPLRPMAVQEWHGFVFVDPSGTGGPLEDRLTGLEDRVGHYGLERLVVKDRHEYVVEANWKVITENYQECYHCSSIHPELCRVSPPDSGENWLSPGAWVGGWQDLRDHAVTMSLDGHSDGVPIGGLDDVELRRIDYLGVFPNLLISLHPDYVMTHRMVPLSPGRTWVECAWAFPPENDAKSDFSPAYAVDFWDITNREDWAACESVQRGLSSGFAEAGPLSPDEDAVYQFVTMVARGYLGRSLAAVS